MQQAVRVSPPVADFIPRPGSSRATGRLIIISNRVGYPGQMQAGGLAQALRALLARQAGMWVGWSGKFSEAEEVHSRRVAKIDYLALDLCKSDFQTYYRDFSNRTLWPLLHDRLDLMVFRREALEGYWRVNRKFADLLARQLRPSDTLWIHDYHLIPLAELLRERGISCRIGFFLHTPLPASQLLRRLPGHRELFGTLASYDLVGLQTSSDADALIDYFHGEHGARIESGGILALNDGRLMRVGAFPIGIDIENLIKLAQASAGSENVRALRQSLGSRALLIGVDRLDYSKGLPERMAAFGELLDREPAMQGKTTFLQIAPVSRREVFEYRCLGRKVQSLVGAINGRYAHAAWTPVRYVNRSYSLGDLAGFYRLARVGVVTPLRDGMNLVAKEYLASQNPQDPGVLILSEFAGAAAELEPALLVNPFDIGQCAQAMHRALTMPLSERRERWQKAMDILRRQDVHAWGRSFLAALQLPTGALEVACLHGANRPRSCSRIVASAGSTRRTPPKSRSVQEST